MAGKKTTVDAAAGFFDDITPARNVQQVQNVQPVQDKHDRRKEKSIEYQTERQTVHVHALLFADDMDELKEIAYQKRISTNKLIREILTEYVQAHKKEGR